MTMPSSASARIPGDAALAIGRHEQRRGQRAERRAGIAADLEQRLRQAMTAARRHARHAAGFGMEHRRAEADQHGGRPASRG